MNSDAVYLAHHDPRRADLEREANREQIVATVHTPRHRPRHNGIRIACRAGGWITGVVAAALLAMPVTPAAAKPEDPPKPRPSAIIVRRIEVPVPIDDTTNEATQMAVAAAFAAALAAGTTRVRIQRSRRGSAGSGLIDITDTVRHRT